MQSSIPTFPKRPAIALSLAVAAVAACGSRSPLDPGHRAIAAGGGGAVTTTTLSTTTSSAAMGGGGAGGSAPACGIWDPTAQWQTTAFFDSQTSSRPRLVPYPGDESNVHLTFLGDGDLASIWFWSADFSPWAAPDDAVIDLADAFLGLGKITGYAAGPGGVMFPSPPPDTTGVAHYSSLSLQGGSLIYYSNVPGAPRPLFVARRKESINGSVEALLGYEMVQGDRHRLAVRLVSPLWGSPEYGAAACADAPIAAEAAGTPSAFYLAAGSSRPLGQCDDPANGYGSPSRLQITYYNEPIGQVLSPLAELIEGGAVEAVDATLGEGALWVTYAVALTPLQAQLKVVRVGLTGGVLSGPVDVALVARPVRISAALLGARLAVASVEQTSMGQEIVEVRVLGEGGAAASSFTIVPPAVSGVAIVGEPGGKRIVVALTRGAQGQGQGVTVTRYGCL